MAVNDAALTATLLSEAEPHGAVALGVVAGWSHRDEGHSLAVTLQRGDGFEAGAGRPASRTERVRSSVGVGIEVAAALVAERFEFGEVGGRVHPSQVLELGLGGDDELDLVIEIEIADPVHDREDSTLLLGVQPPAVVGARPHRPGHDQHSDAPVTSSKGQIRGDPAGLLP